MAGKKGGFGKRGASAAPPPRKASGATAAAPGLPPKPKSKRSLAVALVTIGAGAGVAYAFLGGEKADSPERLFSSPAACATGGAFKLVDCEKAWSEARKAHETHAPRYSTLNECEAAWGAGQCAAPSVAPTVTAGYFMPVMTGMLMSRLASGAFRTRALYQRKGDPADQYQVSGVVVGPPPTSSSGSSSGRSGSWSYYSSSGYRGSSGSSGSSSTYTTSSRGGFGSTGSGFSSHS